MHPLGFLALAVILGLFTKYKVYGKIQDFLLKAPTKYIALIGFSLAILSGYCFIVGKVEITKGIYVSGLDLIFEHHLFLAQIFLIVNILTAIVLLLGGVIDRFRYALLLSIINLIIWPLLGMFEIPVRFPQTGFHIGLLTGLSWMAILLNILLFGMESTKSEPKSSFFKYMRRIGSKIQEKYDYGQEMEAKCEKDPTSVPEEYKRTQNAIGLSTVIFGVVLVAWIVGIGFLPVLTGLIGYIGLGAIITVYVAWLLAYSRGKKL